MTGTDTERAIRAATCIGCANGLNLTSTGLHIDGHICTSKHRELLPLFQAATERINALQAFKDYVHKRLDDTGIPVDPPSAHRDAGCRVGGRLDIALTGIAGAYEAAAKAMCVHCDAGMPLDEKGKHITVGRPGETFHCYARAIRALTPADARQAQAERIVCGSADSVKNMELLPADVGGCGESLTLAESYRCVDCGLRFHKGCIQRHWTQVVEQCDIDGTRVNERLFTQSELEKSVVIRCSDCGGTQMWKKTDEGYEVIHGCISGKQVREMIASAEARGRLDGEEHVFQVMAARHFVDTLKVADELSDEKSRAGAILALEEVWFRMTKHHLDWEELKVELAEAAARSLTPDATNGALCTKCGKVFSECSCDSFVYRDEQGRRCTKYHEPATDKEQG